MAVSKIILMHQHDDDMRCLRMYQSVQLWGLSAFCYPPSQTGVMSPVRAQLSR